MESDCANRTSKTSDAGAATMKLFFEKEELKFKKLKACTINYSLSVSENVCVLITTGFLARYMFFPSKVFLILYNTINIFFFCFNCNCLAYIKIINRLPNYKITDCNSSQT